MKLSYDTAVAIDITTSEKQCQYLKVLTPIINVLIREQTNRTKE
jgi:hypothetical protein